LAAEDCYPGVYFEILSAIFLISPDFPALSLALEFLLFPFLAPPVTFAFPDDGGPAYNFLSAVAPFSYLKIVTISTVYVFPSLNPYELNVFPFAKLIIPYPLILPLAENFIISGRISVLTPVFTAFYRQEYV
jgi:hypothetical protein